MPEMENRCSFPREAVTACGIRLLTMWRVRAGKSYRRMAERSRHDSHTKIHQAGNNVVVVRTDGGSGVLVAKGQRHVLKRNSLVLFDFPSLEEYHTLGRNWNFWWVELSTDEAPRLPLHQVLTIPQVSQETERCEKVFAKLQSEQLELRCWAAAVWQDLFHEWWVKSGAFHHTPGRGGSSVQQVLDAIKRSPGDPWPIEAMAAECGCSVSSLRAAFVKTLGQSPGQIRKQMKLAHAYETLRRGDRNVSEVAESLGFCDPFHFSKAFKKQYGFSPSETHNHQR